MTNPAVTPADFAERLLQLAIKPDDPELVKARSEHYRRELLYLRLFSVMYVLEMKAVSAPLFQSVLNSYGEALDRLCSNPGDLNLNTSTLEARFDAYAAAANVSSSDNQSTSERELPYWQLGREFTRVSSQESSGEAEHSEIARHAYVFLKYCQALADFLDKHESELTTS